MSVIDPDNPIIQDDSGDSDETTPTTVETTDITGKISYTVLIIPEDFFDTYKKLLYALSIEGKKIIDDCGYSCKKNGHNVFVCWQLFQSAVAAYNIGERKKATLFINYIESQLPKSISLEQIELDVIDHTYPNVNYYVNDKGAYVFTMQALYDGTVYQRSVTLPASGYSPVVSSQVMYNIFTWDEIEAYLAEHEHTSVFDIDSEELEDIETMVTVKTGSYTVSGDFIYIYVPKSRTLQVLDTLGNAFIFTEDDDMHTTDDGVYYYVTDVSNVILKVS